MKRRLGVLLVVCVLANYYVRYALVQKNYENVSVAQNKQKKAVYNNKLARNA